MFDFIKRIFHHQESPADGLSQLQRESIADLLIIAMYCDHNLSVDEDSMILRIVSHFNWESSESVEVFINRRIGSLRVVCEDRVSMEESIRDAALVLLPKADYTLRVINEFLMIDGEMSPEEKIFLEKVQNLLKSP